MLISDIFIENPLVNSAVTGLSYGEIVRFYVIIKQYNITQCNKKACLALFVNKSEGLKMHFIGFQTTYHHAGTPVPQ